MTMRLLRSTITLVSITCPTLFAQSLNIDIGTLAGSPSSSYGGAAAQPGEWNAIPGNAGGQVHALVDLAGQPVAARLVYEDSSPSCSIDFILASGATGDDAALLDDHHDFSPTQNCQPGKVTILDLEPGIYDIYTYVFETIAPQFTSTKVFTIPFGLNNSSAAGGAVWSGSHVLGETFTLQTTATWTSGEIQLTLSHLGETHYVPLNGLQLVKRHTVQTYCTAKTSSCGTTPSISVAGLSSLSWTGYLFPVTWGPVANQPGNLGILIATTDGPLATPFQHPLGYGWLCITPGPGFSRVLPPVTPVGSGSCNGFYTVNFNNWLGAGGMPQVNALVAANGFADVDAQGWYRDPLAPGGANLTDAVQFTVLP
jgi:hypothetical protein